MCGGTRPVERHPHAHSSAMARNVANGGGARRDTVGVDSPQAGRDARVPLARPLARVRDGKIWGTEDARASRRQRLVRRHPDHARRRYVDIGVMQQNYDADIDVNEDPDRRLRLAMA